MLKRVLPLIIGSLPLIAQVVSADDLGGLLGNVQIITPSMLNMVSASLPGFVVIGVLTVIVMFFANLKGAIFRVMRRPKW